MSRDLRKLGVRTQRKYINRNTIFNVPIHCSVIACLAVQVPAYQVPDLK